MEQRSKQLLCHLIGKAEHGAAHTKDLDQKMMAFSFLLPFPALEGLNRATVYVVCYFTPASVFSFQVSAII